MTIVTKPAFTEKKPDKTEDFTEVELPPDLPEKKDVDSDYEGPIAVVGPPRRRTSSLCMLLVALFILATGVLGGLYLYKHFMLKRARFTCSFPYRYQNQDYNYQDDSLPHSLTYPKEKVELDLQNQQFEKFDVPRLGNNIAGRVIHDFSLNLSAIVDSDAGRCYIMKLNRDVVAPPQNLFDLIEKMMDGEYVIDPEVVRENYRVVRPRIRDYSKVGVFITAECNDKRTYRLEKVTGDAPEQEEVSETLDDICMLPPVEGPCRAYIPSFYFDVDRLECRRFIYGGCHGNKNRFSSKETCKRKCGARMKRAVKSSAVNFVVFDGKTRQFTITDVE